MVIVMLRIIVIVTWKLTVSLLAWGFPQIIHNGHAVQVVSLFIVYKGVTEAM